MVRTNRKLPIDWTRYEPIGGIIKNTRFFAFKTPLRLELQNRIPKNKCFTTHHLFRKIAELGKSIGLIINTSNTGRYYDRNDIEGMMVDYSHIPCPGRGFLEHDDMVKLFFKSVDGFIASHADDDLLIGIHCSNGVNRSGYLICRYLIDRLGWSSHEALEAFENSRGYPIERGAYVQALHRADRERRLKSKQGIEQDEESDSIEQYKPKNKRRKVEIDETVDPEASFDQKITAQMMQHILQLEKQFKMVAGEVAAKQSQTNPLVYSLPSLPVQIPAASATNSEHPSQSIPNQKMQPTLYSSQAYKPPNHQQQLPQQKPAFTKITSLPGISQKVRGQYQHNEQIFDELTHAKTESISDEDDDDGDEDESSPQIDFDSMGKVDIREVSTSQQRRQRRKKREHMFAVMKRGRFWEINEMRKDAMGK